MSRSKTSMPGPATAKPSRLKPDGTKAAASALEMPGGVYRFFADRGVRETLESVVVAVLLAILFRTFMVENYIIPTGSMAPGLMGHHIDLVCEKCNYQYQTNANCEAPTTNSPDKVACTFCPICHYRTLLVPNRIPDHHSNQGDRITVNKYIYDFTEPQRFDVIVFKNPTNAKQNYIKRLVGLPGESITIECGDLFSHVPTPSGSSELREIIRKPINKMQALLHLVDDTDHIAEDLQKAQWPLRWQHWEQQANPVWSTVVSQNKPVFGLAAKDAAEIQWLSYRHLEPDVQDWDLQLDKVVVPQQIKDFNGKLITDYYAYNSFENKAPNKITGVWDNYSPIAALPSENGLHWVGDLSVEAWCEVQSATGQLILQVVEGGVRYQCRIDVAAGTAQWHCSDPDVEFVDSQGKPAAPQVMDLGHQGAGQWHVQFAQCDDRLFLWINGRAIESDVCDFRRAGPVYPKWQRDDWGDLQPVAIGGQNLDVSIRRLRVLRDTYYTSVRGNNIGADPHNEYGVSSERVREILKNPMSWATSRGQELFDARLRPGPAMFEIAADGYMPCGDNSPQSQDSRIWNNPPFVRRDMLIGRAMFVYWPHSLNSPVRYLPNFKKMRSIK